MPLDRSPEAVLAVSAYSLQDKQQSIVSQITEIAGEPFNPSIYVLGVKWSTTSFSLPRGGQVTEIALLANPLPHRPGHNYASPISVPTKRRTTYEV